MNTGEIMLAGAALVARADGALWWPDQRLLAVGDLHLGRAGRGLARGGALLPPYEVRDTLDRLDAALAETGARTLVLLGDSFDDMAAARALEAEAEDRLLRIAGGRRLVWIAGNHDPGPAGLPGSHVAEARIGPLTFRHIARAGAGPGEVSGHYHPKLRLVLRGQPVARPCFLADARRIVLPAFGTYTGGLDVRDAAFDALFGADAVALLTGREVVALARAQLGPAGDARDQRLVSRSSS